MALAALLASAERASANSSCPANLIGVSRTDVGFWSHEPTGSVIWSDSAGDKLVAWDATQLCPEGCYDLPKATLAARGFNTLYGPGATYVSVSDEYVVVGPANSPLDFEAVLQLTATIETEGTVRAQVRLGDSSAEGIERTTTGISQVALPLVIVPGSPFVLGASLDAVGGRLGGMADAVATVRFRGLPREYVVVSCQGFDGETPARPATWGGLKNRYR